ncbi:MAG: tRNA pseudouridine(55) synthase TruB [Calditrichaeota bacterium]|nr:MAG: tRNA pseudouridine(55) synthase TruB [Calditrichota bacterium]
MRISQYSSRDGAIVAINKPAGWTSFDVVNKIRRLTGIKKVGHAGTLDPFATGVLLICLGPATKKSSQLMDLPKEYLAEVALGQETDTLDPEGKVITEKAVPELSEEAVNAVLPSFLGEIEQEIPSYSAARVKGKRLYQLARQGKEVPRLFKKVRIDAIELVELDKQTLTLRVECGRGTYIRTLARDIARQLGTVGYVRKLVRTRVGEYTLETALTIEEFERQLKRTTSTTL